MTIQQFHKGVFIFIEQIDIEGSVYKSKVGEGKFCRNMVKITCSDPHFTLICVNK